MEIGIVVADADGYIIYMNNHHARFLGVDAEMYIGRHATDLLASTRLHIVAQTGRKEINYPHEVKNDNTIVHRVPIKRNGKVIAVLGMVLFSSTDKVKRLAERLSKLQSTLRLYESELQALYSTRYTFDNIVGESPAFLAVKEEAMKAATHDFPVLITGASGTGKELFAQAIHADSICGRNSFVRVNCAAIPKDLFEAELFGYERGAFTGANPIGKAGKFEIANQGTIFLDEIGDLPLSIQPKLLRVLEMKEFERLGGNRLIRSDFRLITATNHKLAEKVKNGSFRADLYYRLNVIPLALPSLKERRDDIMPLARYFVAQSTSHKTGPAVSFAMDAERQMVNHDWPGNLRELKNVVERILAFVEGSKVRAKDLPFYLHHRVKDKFGARKPSTLKEYLLAAEKYAINEALKESKGNKSLAARMLGIHRTRLYQKMKKWDCSGGTELFNHSFVNNDCIQTDRE